MCMIERGVAEYPLARSSESEKRRNPMPSHRHSLKTWSDHLAGLLASANDLTLLIDRLLAAMDTLSPGAIGAIALFNKGYTPIKLWTNSSEIDATGLSRAVTRAFELDPYFAAFMDGQAGCLPLWEIAPDGFKDSVCYQELYVGEGMVDEINHLNRIEGGGVLIVGAGRSDRMFTADEVELHKSANAVISACATHFVRLIGTEDPAPAIAPIVPVDGALEDFGTDVLTPRERDVIQLVLRGHSTESAARQLGISWNTVKRHRLAAYAKLRVGSQGELFYTFLRTIGLRPDP